MRLQLPASHPLKEPLETLAHFLLLCIGALVVWAWSKAGVPMEVKLAGYVAMSLGLAEFVLMSLERIIDRLARIVDKLRDLFRGRRR